MRAWLSPALLALALVGCGGARPPEELSGLWSAGPAACQVGVGVRFRSGAIVAVYDRQVEVLFARPRYEVARGGDSFEVRIAYDLPRITGGARTAGSHGVLVLARQRDGGLAPVRHVLVDGRTGATRVRLNNDPATSLMTLQPCGRHPWSGGIRGLTP